MRCPYCGSLDTQVKDSRPTEDASSIRRRRICPDCGGRFTTFERVQLRELMVVKKNGRRAPFDRDKLHALGRGRAAQAPGRAGTRRAHDQRHRAPARKPGRRRHPDRADRRTRDGGPERRSTTSPMSASPRSIAISARRATSTPSSANSKPNPSRRRRRRNARGPPMTRRRPRKPTTTRWMDGGAGASAGADSASPRPIRRSARCSSRTGVVVGRGVTQPGGRPHAERLALAEAGEAARGATLYVTLEPCSHHGVTPPCAEAIVAAGVAPRRLRARRPQPARRRARPRACSAPPGSRPSSASARQTRAARPSRPHPAGDAAAGRW